MQEPVVLMTKAEYFTNWLSIGIPAAVVFLVAIYFVGRAAVRWGVEHGMERFAAKESKGR